MSNKEDESTFLLRGSTDDFNDLPNLNEEEKAVPNNNITRTMVDREASMQVIMEASREDGGTTVDHGSDHSKSRSEINP